MKIWLDDLRPAPWGYESARSVNEAKTLIGRRRETASRSRCWDLDHDLEILQVRAAMPIGPGLAGGAETFTLWRSIPRIPVGRANMWKRAGSTGRGYW